MKLSFKLTGKNWFSLYFAVFLFYGIPTIAMQFISGNMKHDPTNYSNVLYFVGLFTVMMLSIVILMTPILKRFVGNVYIGDTALEYKGKISEFILLTIGQFLLCIVTLGIYFPWCVTNLWKYFIGKTSYNGSKFVFNGKGLHLLGIFIITLLLPVILYSIAIGPLAGGLQAGILLKIFNQIVVFVVLIPYLYFMYKWMVNISYKEFLIKWETNHIQSMIKILKEMLLTILTVGIYYPVALVKLYEYFCKFTTVSKKNMKYYIFSAEFDYFKAWKLMWSQILLTIVTLGIYGAWAYCRLTGLFVDNTTLVRNEVQTNQL